MNELHLHIIAFDIPYPPVYGGVIDVFYQIKSLSEAGVMIHLHAFDYGKGKRAAELEKMCFSVNYYTRRTRLMAALGFKPYITASRKSVALINELVKDDYPILFEGLHSCFYINDKRLKGRLKLFRATNIEHRYYLNLGLTERNLFKKMYFYIEGIKLWYYESVIHYADLILAVSTADRAYFENKYPVKKAITLPCFHANTFPASNERGVGNYILFHGNLEVAENERAAIYLMREVMNDIDYPFIIAGNSPSTRLVKIAKGYSNVILKSSPDESTMEELIRKAKINLLFTFQATGLKLKLLNSLFMGSFVLANNKMLHGTGLEPLCTIANTSEEMKKQVNLLIQTEYIPADLTKKLMALSEDYDNRKNALMIIELMNNKFIKHH